MFALTPAVVLQSSAATKVRHVPQQPYTEYTCRDKFKRAIHFFVSDGPKAKLPLLVYVQGSGCGSLFGVNGTRTFPQAGHATLYDVVADHARTLIVEKPGVEFGDPPGDVQHSARKAFLEEHTLDRWSEAIEASIKAASGLEEVDAKKVFVLGHSEGGLVAAKVARDMHTSGVGLLAGGGPSQLFDLETYARKGYFFAEVSPLPEVRAAYVSDQWKAIQHDPNSVDKFFFGHPYKRWSSFLKSSPIEQLKSYGGRVFIGQGLDDKAVNPDSANMLAMDLKRENKDVTLEAVPGADHSFARSDGTDGWKDILTRFAKWAKLI